jgi:hypothetical protein
MSLRGGYPRSSRITVPSTGRNDLFDTIIPPESTRTTESWNVPFRAHSYSGENEDAVGGGNWEHG